MKNEKCSQANELGYVVKSEECNQQIPNTSVVSHMCRGKVREQAEYVRQFALQQESQFALQQENQFALQQESQFALQQENQFAL
ncbi:hypothetical protein [Capnocytophaga gingivalis]|uniref:hypothetical protein n=1 Tax=Capnocytophaga gingivalis TaxID=1017 RepID=UPI00403D7C6F